MCHIPPQPLQSPLLSMLSSFYQHQQEIYEPEMFFKITLLCKVLVFVLFWQDFAITIVMFNSQTCITHGHLLKVCKTVVLFGFQLTYLPIFLVLQYLAMVVIENNWARALNLYAAVHFLYFHFLCSCWNPNDNVTKLEKPKQVFNIKIIKENNGKLKMTLSRAMCRESHH